MCKLGQYVIIDFIIDVVFVDPLLSPTFFLKILVNLCEIYVYLVLLTPEKQFVRYIQNDLITFPMAVLFNRMNLLALKYLCCLEQNCLQEEDQL